MRQMGKLGRLLPVVGGIGCLVGLMACSATVRMTAVSAHDAATATTPGPATVSAARPAAVTASGATPAPAPAATTQSATTNAATAAGAESASLPSYGNPS